MGNGQVGQGYDKVQTCFGLFGNRFYTCSMPDSLFSKEYAYLCDLLVNVRVSRNLTQADVAKRLGKPQSFVSKYERGERRLDVVEFLQVAGALEIDATDVIEQLVDYRNTDAPAFPSVLDAWRITAHDLTALLEQNPSLRGMLLGYVADLKLQTLWLTHPDISALVKDDDHDRTKKGDRRIVYKGQPFVLEVKSLQTHSIRYEDGVWSGKTQVDASDRREVVLPTGERLNTTLLLVGEFDVLAVNVFAFENQWRFVFARNQDLPRTTFNKYTPAQQEHLLTSLVPVTWPPQPPFTSDLYSLLDAMLTERGVTIS